MDWLLIAVLLGFGAICGVVMRLPAFVLALLAAAVIVLFANWSQGAAAVLRQAVIAVVVLQGGYAAGIVIRSLRRSLRGRRAAPGEVVQRRAVPLHNEPKRR